MRSRHTRSVIGLVLACLGLALVWTPSVFAGGWAVTPLDPLPNELRPGAAAVGLTIATLVALRNTAPTAPGAAVHEQGRTLFQQKGCIGCHSVTDKGLVSRTPMAPDLSALGQRAAARRPGLAADAYVKESVRQPQAYIVPGF